MTINNEKTIMSFQTKGIRLQLIVKNNKVYLIENRKKVKIDYPYRENWMAGDKIYHSFMDTMSHYFLNEIIWRIGEDNSFSGIEDF